MKRLEYHLTVQSDGGVSADFFNGEERIPSEPGKLNLSDIDTICKDDLPIIESDHNMTRDFYERFGTLLYYLLFPYPVSGHFEEHAWRLIEQHPGRYSLAISILLQQGLRPDVAALPLEYLYCPRGKTFLATDPRCALTRRPDSQASPPRVLLEPDESLRIMLVHLQPSGVNTVGLTRINNFLNELAEEKSKVLPPLVLKNPAPAQVENEINEYKPHIFHLLAHGRFDDRGTSFALVDDSGQAVRWYRDRSFSDLFLKHRPDLILLHACEGGKTSDIHNNFSQGASILVRNHIPAVIAMQYPITNAVGWHFFEEFYEQIIATSDLDSAAQNARRFLSKMNEKSPDDHADRAFGVPAFWMQPEAYRLFPSEEEDEMNIHDTLTVRITAPDGMEFETDVPQDISGDQLLDAFLDYWRPPISYKKSESYALRYDISGKSLLKIKGKLRSLNIGRKADFKIMPEPLESDAAISLYVENNQQQRYKTAILLNTKVGKVAEEFLKNSLCSGPVVVEMLGGSVGQVDFRPLNPEATLFDEGVYDNAVLRIYCGSEVQGDVG